MTSRELKSLLPDDDRKVLVWTLIEGQWLLQDIDKVNPNDPGFGAITLELQENTKL